MEAIREVSLEVSSGEFVAILGPSGCGKSTLLELCAGLEPVSGGEILIDGEKVAGPEPEGGDGVPGAFAVSRGSTSRSNVVFGLKMKGVGQNERWRRGARGAASA